MGYFKDLDYELENATNIAEQVKTSKGDPIEEVEISAAEDVAERVEGLVGVDGVAERIRDLSEKDGKDREEIALDLAVEFASGRFEEGSKKERIDGALRSVVSLLTEGVVAAPIEGIDKVEVIEHGGGDYLKVEYAGPIRSAGGTAQAISVLVADYVRRQVGVGSYQPTEEEIERSIEEVKLYEGEKGLQYKPSDEEIRKIVENCPIKLDGEPTTEGEVSVYRDLDGINTNRGRGGMCLVLAEGIAQKSSKLEKQVDSLGIDGWGWIKSLGKSKKEDEDSANYLGDITAGRPVVSQDRIGGFRLRYGRSRNTGLASVGLNPATMVVLGGFLATGTQIKVADPGKAAGISPVDSLEGPTVRLKNGEVKRIDDESEADRVKDGIDEIIDAGEIGIGFGEFLENNRNLLSPCFSYDWWIQELKENIGRRKGTEKIEELKEAFDLEDLGSKQAFRLSKKYDIPLHPNYSYLWSEINGEEYKKLAEIIDKREAKRGENVVLEEGISDILEKLLVPHIQNNNENIEVSPDYFFVLKKCLDSKVVEIEDTLKVVSEVSGVKIYDRASTRVGARMGRPEKSKPRELSPPVHSLFPIGEAGGSQRDIEKAAEKRSIEVEVGVQRCNECGREEYKSVCPCGGRRYPIKKCPECEKEIEDDKCPRCDKSPTSIEEVDLNISGELRDSLKNVQERKTSFDTLKGVKGLTSEDKTPEPLEKGILRAKYDLSVFKDGTIRYDTTDLPLTSFRPDEIDVSLEKLYDLGYKEDLYGDSLERESQLVELKPQDIVVSSECGEHLVKVAGFIDELLEKYYGYDSYYNIEDRNELIGELIVGLAPHTSAGVLGRILGFTDSSVCYAHPFFHASKRRNCDGDEDSVMLLMDGLLNFSKSFLPDRRGGRMDAPLVLTSKIDPEEVDDEAYNIDKVENYPVSFYEDAIEGKNPKKVDVDIAGSSMSNLFHTLETTKIDSGPPESIYKTLGSMEEKAEAQLKLARKLRSVDEKNVAELVLESHFLPDLEGNLRAFSQQEFRCTSCNKKYRRPPLSGGCQCGGELTLTVHEGSVRKYLGIALRVAKKYNVSNYTLERIEQLERRIDSVFQNDKERQSGIEEFI